MRRTQMTVKERLLTDVLFLRQLTSGALDRDAILADTDAVFLVRGALCQYCCVSDWTPNVHPISSLSHQRTVSN